MKYSARHYISLSSIIITSVIFPLNSCKDKPPDPGCPLFGKAIDIVPPYRDPICHPSGKIIGYNYTPIKEIKYHYGYNCPFEAQYIYDNKNSGFWIMDSDGQNQRRVLPYRLNCPSWSPDGNWITFSNRNIYKMPFDGECFDTTSIIQLTFSGYDFLPSWSPDGNYIAYDNTECGSAATPIPPNSCGILIMEEDGNNKSFVARGRLPYWGSSEDTIYYMMRYYDLINKQENKIIDTKEMSFTLEPSPSFNSQKTKIFFLGRFNNVPNPIKLYSVDPSGYNFKLASNDPILYFSFMPDGRIVYLYFDGTCIDEEKGTLWIMDENGLNKHQLTYNDFITSIY
jgi:Tol biopolymer transport system component